MSMCTGRDRERVVTGDGGRWGRLGQGQGQAWVTKEGQ